ncbi:MAG: NAD/NADP octopine/nopaline dehydrogenase family protein [Bacteroidales bacterium]|nr:NAD/NADP octopine/nopaline dehydrogenase family protein [Bacteroidales bacterium]MEE1021426.1 NAD/NADP octopine/nopaline dehydrogenase family protein [Bacteroidales bacterium]
MKQLVVCGGGNSAHTLIPLLHDSIFDVSIFTSRPEEWANTIELEWQNSAGEVMGRYSGELRKASNKPEELFPNADYIIFCMPVHKYRVALHEIAPFINKEKNVVLGAVYGQAGWNWMVEEIVKEYGLNNLVAFSFGLIPWVSRLIEYGHKGLTYGCMSENYAAVKPKSYFNQINDEFFNQVCYRWFGKGKVDKSENFISLTLSVDNQIIHTARCYALHKQYGRTWTKKEDVPLFYRTFDDLSAKLMEGLDRDYSKIRETIKLIYPKKKFKHMVDYLTLEYFSHKYWSKDAKDSILSSQTLHSITTPVIQNEQGSWEISKDHRFLLDDIYYGNCIAKWMAEQLNIETPTINEILHWAQEIRGEKFIDENNHLILDSKDLTEPFKSGLPCFYGYKAIDECID